MKPPLFTYEEIEHIRESIILMYAPEDNCSKCESILEKCNKTLNADRRFREPHK